MGTTNAPSASCCGCLYPSSPTFLERIVVIRDASVGRLFLVVSVINFRKKPSVISMASRKGVVHFVGSPQVESFLLLVVGCMR